MEQKYLEELKNLKFPRDPETVPTVLETRAYHNTFGGGSTFTDCSFAVLKMPEYYSAAIEKDTRDKMLQVLRVCYEYAVEHRYFSLSHAKPVDLLNGRWIQVGFDGALSRDEIVSEYLKLLEYTFEETQKAYFQFDSGTEKDEKIKKYFNRIGHRLKIIHTFIEAGSVSYEYIPEHFDPME